MADGAEGGAYFAQRHRLERGEPAAEQLSTPLPASATMIKVSSSIWPIPSAGRASGEDAQVVGVMHQLGQRQVAGRRLAADEPREAVGAQRFLDRPDAVGPFGVPGGGSVAFEIGLGDEEGGHGLGNCRCTDSLTLCVRACQTSRHGQRRSFSLRSPQLAARARPASSSPSRPETVYGLGADATNSDAVLKIYETKGRPRFNPLIVHVADLAMAERLVSFSPMARKLAEFWPGPLTLVLPRRPEAGSPTWSRQVSKRSGSASRPIRWRSELIRAAGRPLAAPSANRSGKLSPTTAAQVERSFNGTVPVLEGGASQAGVESTILAVEGDW